jgi:hypothetical protein
MSKKAGEKYININYSYYRKLLRDSQRVQILKGHVKKMHDILKRVDEPKVVEKEITN